MYVAKQYPRGNRLNGHTYGLTSKFSDQSWNTPNVHEPEYRELIITKVLDDLYRLGAEDLGNQDWEEYEAEEEVKVEECDEGNVEEIWDTTIEDI